MPFPEHQQVIERVVLFGSGRNSSPGEAEMAQARRASMPADGELGRTRILVVEARYYADIADALLEGARQALEAAAASFDRITVPGCLELPTAMAIAVEAA